MPTRHAESEINLLTSSAPPSHIYQVSVQDLKAYMYDPSVSGVCDDFEDGILDPYIWGVINPYNDSSVIEHGGVCELSNRGILHTLRRFDPALVGDVKITCEWRNVFECGSCGYDALYLHSRSDLSQTGCCGQLSTGVQLQISGTNDTANLTIMKNNASLGQDTAPFSVPHGATVCMELIDSTVLIVGRVWELGNPTNFVELMLPGVPAGVLGDRVGFYNRESISGENVVNLDNVSVEAVDCNGHAYNYGPITPNSAGPGAVIGYSGSLSLSANDYRLHATGCPPNQFALFYYGPSQIQVPFGNGFRCVGGKINRLPVVYSGAAGTPSYLVDFTQPPFSQILPSEQWNFQCWYRDPAGGGFFFNLSDALATTFCP